MRKISANCLIIAFLALLVLGCEKNAIPEVTEPVAEDMSYVKFFFHAEDAPNAGFFFNDEKVTAENSSGEDQEQALDYTSVYPSNAYAVIPSGSGELEVRTLEAQNLASTSITTEAQNHYSAYLVGTSENYDIAFIEDNLPEPNHDLIYWRFVNTMANIPFSVDVYAIRAAVPATENSPAEDARVISLGQGIPYKSSGEYTELAPGSYTFKVFPSGTDYDPQESESFLEHGLTLASLGRVYTTQIRGTYTEDPGSSHIDYWRDR
tara:strand:- start:1415 stop:2206 length:792 start_codon:yes stop_codon:yes gene_type:complete